MSNRDDEMDQRFREMIRAEFGDVAGSRSSNEEADPSVPSPPPQARRFGVRKLKDPIEYFNLSRAIEEAATDDDHERWDPPGDASLRRPRLRVVIGAALLVVALVMGVMVLAGLRPDWWVGLLTLLAAGFGLGLLLSALPRHRDDDGDGARL